MPGLEVESRLSALNTGLCRRGELRSSGDSNPSLYATNCLAVAGLTLRSFRFDATVYVVGLRQGISPMFFRQSLKLGG